MRLQFNPNQKFQLDAVDAIVDLFDGQERGTSEFSVIKVPHGLGLFDGQGGIEAGVGNRLLLDEDKLRQNARKIQEQNDIENDGAMELAAWDLFDPPANRFRKCPHFSVEMETGTGKTYVYLRTIFEMCYRYGFQKFIIVVPSVAIREGVLKNIEITSDHFRALYSDMPFESYVYDAKKVNRLRQFATSSTLQILVINIDAFRKNFTGSADEEKSNVIYKESDRLGGHQPIEFVQSARPIVIIDEPQSVDSTEKSQEGIKALNPLMTLRYSATHRNPYNLLYRVDPIRAFELKLVKQIVVASVDSGGSVNESFVKVESIEYKKGLKAKLRMLVKSADGPAEKSITVKPGDDLYSKSGELHHYQDGFRIADLTAEPGYEHVQFSNGLRLSIGEEIGGVRSDVWRAQIKKTVEEHLKKEVRTRVRGIKVLSLFFVDRVSSYRDYDIDGNPIKGKFAEVVEEELKAFAADSRFASLDWLKLPAEKLHNGYFSGDKRRRKDGSEGVIWKDTKGSTSLDDDTYSLIMREKERLLSMEEPLRFIFSHSALREGWDNPNVFQICTLNETQSTMKKRQEIGRGLRLPVDQNGVRVYDEGINKLYVMANESYEAFAKALQNEYEEDCGVKFGKVPLTALARLVQIVDGEERAIGRTDAEALRDILVEQKILDISGRIQAGFNPHKGDFKIELPDDKADLAPALIDLLSGYQIENYVQRERDEGVNKLKKGVLLTPEFEELWSRIKPRTTYAVEFQTLDLVRQAVDELKKIPRIEKPTMRVRSGLLDVGKSGIKAGGVSVAEEVLSHGERPLPDILGYLQNETELTRATLVEILTKSERLGEFFDNPQRFMDTVAKVLKSVLHRLLVDGIKYERLPNGEWDQMLFKDEELINYLTAQKVKHSIYDYVVCESEIEREFARQLDQREDVKLFVKLPKWFVVETPVGEYIPDWAIVKEDSSTVYLVRETKGTKDFTKLRNSEVDKVRCGQKHFEALGQDFAVVTSAGEI